MSNKNGVSKRMILAVGLFVLSAVGTVVADIRLPAVIGDNMVLQQGKKVSIWGWAEPNEEVMVGVSWHGMKWGVRASTDGKWMFKMNAPKAGGPYEITLEGKNKITIKNILVGEVWVCSGQSNMQLAVQQSANAEQEIAAANYPNIRLFTVERKVADRPQSDCVGSWTACSPQMVAGFSAVGYFFGRELHKSLGVPIGLIHTSWGGTPAEAWTSAGVLKTLDDYKARMEEIERVQTDPAKFENKYQQELADWLKKISPAGPDGKGSIEPDFNDSSWKQMDLPKLWDDPDLANFDGMVWFRKVVEVPADWVGKELILQLGPIDDMDTTWVNGVQVGSHQRPGQWKTNRRYKIPANVVKSGPNVIVVEVLDTADGGGIYGRPDEMKLMLAGGKADDAISLAGAWRYKKGLDQASIPAQPRAPLRIDNQNAPTALYNAMIAPLIPYAIQGAIWYQGESNASRAYQYRTLFPAMITNWRQDWGQSDFTFLYVQLANFMATKPEPNESTWAELREAQLMTLKLLNTGMAVIIDIGDANDIHPKNKQDVGKRLAFWALAKTYGKDVVYSGPIYKSMKVESGKAILSFEHVAGGLVSADGGPLKGFAVAGADRKFVWADAKIEGQTIIVSSEKMSEPVAVRYGWADNPICNLYNKEGLPVSPFRTDDWPGITVNQK